MTIFGRTPASRDQEDATLHHVLLALETGLLDPAVRRQPAAVGALLAEEFREFGKSGRVYSKQEILALLAQEPEKAIHMEDFEVTRLGETFTLATYKSVTAEGQARRSSLWMWREGCWLMIFHQGTPIPPASV